MEEPLLFTFLLFYNLFYSSLSDEEDPDDGRDGGFLTVNFFVDVIKVAPFLVTGSSDLCLFWSLVTPTLLLDGDFTLAFDEE